MSEHTLDAAPSAVGAPRELRSIEPPCWAPGDIVNDRYRVTALVGEGGMGRVYRVSDPLHPERDLALKTLAGSRVATVRADLFKSEFRTMAALAHPHIARVYDFETLLDPVQLAFTMEYLEGRDLLAATDGLALDAIVDLAVDACRALHYLHSHGVIHADFKPANVIVAGGVVKVLDFGLSGIGEAGLAVGTPAYMAPEVCHGRAVDARVDLYAFGITLFQLLHRRPPFVGRDAAQIAEAHAAAPLPFDDAVPPRLRAVIQRLCAKKPADRYAGAGEVIEALAVALGRSYAVETRETRRSYAASPRLVGRDGERDALVEHCLARGRGAPSESVLAVIAGPSGIGKSRLAREVRQRLQLAGLTFVESDCYQGSFDELAPLRQWTEALVRLARAHGRPDADARAPSWLDDGDGGASLSLADAEARRQMRLCELADFVLALAERVGLVLYINDLQWARGSVTDFVRVLSERQLARQEAGGAARLALLLSFRDDEIAGTPVEELLAAVPSERRLEARLAPLPPEGTAALLAAMLASATVPAAFSARVAAETGGNPFFVEEVVRALIERGDIALEDGHWSASTDVAALDLPGSVAAALERRVAALDDDARTLLDWLAVYAQPMPLEILVAVSDLGAAAVARGLALLVERQLATVENERARPGHDQLREHRYRRLDDEARRAAHHRIAGVLAQLARDEREHVFERAHHHWHAGDVAEATIWSERAANLAEQTFATDVAIDNYERLRTLAVRRGDETARRRLSARLLELCTLAGHYQRILDVSDEELERDPSLLERGWLVQLQGEALGSQGKPADGFERLRLAANLLGERIPQGRRARRLFIGWSYLRHRMAARLGFDYARPLQLGGDERRRREILAVAYHLMSVYSMLTGDDEGIALIFAGLNSAHGLGQGDLSRRLLQNSALVHQLLGNHADAERVIRAAHRVSATPLDRMLLLPTETFARQVTQRPLYEGQRTVGEAEQDLIEAIELLSTRTKKIYAHMARMVAALTLRHFTERLAYRPEVARWADAMRGTVHYALVEGTAATLALLDGQPRQAQLAFGRADRAASPMYHAWVNADFAYACALTGDTALASRCVEAAMRTLAPITTTTAPLLWAAALSLAATLVLAARDRLTPWLRECLATQVAHLARGARRRPPLMTLFYETGRLALGQPALPSLRQARRHGAAIAARERTPRAFCDAGLAATLAARLVGAPDWAAWSQESLADFEPRVPAPLFAEIRALLTSE